MFVRTGKLLGGKSHRQVPPLCESCRITQPKHLVFDRKLGNAFLCDECRRKAVIPEIAHHRFNVACILVWMTAFSCSFALARIWASSAIAYVVAGAVLLAIIAGDLLVSGR